MLPAPHGEAWRVIAIVALASLLNATGLSGSGHSALPDSPARPLRFVTFNLFHGGPYSGLNGNDRHLERRLELVIEELKVLRPDVIGLQEVSVSRRRGSTRRVRLPIEGFHLTGGPCLGYPRAPLVSGRPTAPGRPRQPARGADHRRTGPEKDASPGYSRIIRASHGPEREMGNANMVARTQAGYV